MQLSSEQIKVIREASFKAQSKSYSPYSNFKVGCAILHQNGLITLGANIENASYPATICAEQTAVVSARMNCDSAPIAIAISSSSGSITSPCGVCRQVLREYIPLDTPVYLFTNEDGKYIARSLEQLLPLSFGPDDLLKSDN